MDSPPDDISILLWGYRNRPLATSAIALTIAELLTKDGYGERVLQDNQPFNVIDGDDRWIIEGSNEYDESKTLPGGQVIEGKVTVEILKANCRVVKFSREVAFVPPEESR